MDTIHPLNVLMALLLLAFAVALYFFLMNEDDEDDNGGWGRGGDDGPAPWPTPRGGIGVKVGEHIARSRDLVGRR